MREVEVGLGDSPMRISERLSGNPYRYGELLQANPHKSIVYQGGMPTFESLGLGEKLFVPLGFVGESSNQLTNPPSDSNKLLSGQIFRADNGGGKPIWSNNKRCCLYFQSDSNLVFYAATPTRDGFVVQSPPPWPMWDAGTSGSGGHLVTMQRDGNLVMVRTDQSVVWSSGTPGHPGGWLQVQDEGLFALVDNQGAYWSPNTRGFEKASGVWYRGKTSTFDKIKSTASDAVSAVESIPVVGDVVKIAGDVYSAPLKLANSIASGDRLDHALIDGLKNQLAVAKEIAPYAQTIVSVVPGLGTGVSMALGAGLAIAEGQSITDAAKAAVRSAIPGGPLVQAGFDAALKVASGENVGQVALEAARTQLPAAAQKAFDIGLAVATGEKIQTALANSLTSMVMDAASGAASGPFNSVLAAGQQVLANAPGLSDAIKLVKSGAATDGFKFAAGLLSHAGINEQALTSARSQMSSEMRQGFDAALKTQENKIAWLKNVTSAPVSATISAATAARAIVAKAAAQNAAAAAERAANPTTEKISGLDEATKKWLLATPDKGLLPLQLEMKRQLLAQATTKPPLRTLDPPKNLPAAPAKVAAIPAKPVLRALDPPKHAPAPVAQTPAKPPPSTPPKETAAVQLAPSIAAGRYAPYPKMGLGAPPHRGSGHAHHGGGGGGHHVPHGGRAAPGWGWSDVPWSTEVVTTTETCRTWGAPVEMSPAMQVSAKVALGASGGQPVTMRSDGVLYLFTLENGAISARPCAATGLSGCFDMTSVTWGPAITGMSGDMRRAGLSAVNGSRGRPRAVKGPDGTDYLFAIENGTLTARPAVT